MNVAKKGGFGNEGPWLPAARDAAIAEGGDGVRHEKVSAPREGMHVEVDMHVDVAVYFIQTPRRCRLYSNG